MAQWHRLDRSLILASASPRREEILRLMGFTFDVCKPKVNERQFLCKGRGVRKSLLMLAEAKAWSVAQMYPNALVLGADTVVVYNKDILGKPVAIDEAKQMLKKLSGKTHFVYTAVALISRETNFKALAIEKTDVSFRRIFSDELEEYLSIDDYSDKAGAYAIQGRAMMFVRKIKGCYYNVVGLPIYTTISLFKKYIRAKGHCL